MARLCVNLLVAAALAASAGVMADDSARTPAQTLAARSASDFVYKAPVKAAAANASLSQPRMLEQWAALDGQGISQTYFKLGACALRPPHVHQFAAGLLYVISGSNVSVGFVTNNGTAVTNYISTGASALFPQGLIHYQQNLGCDAATYTISYSSEAPGTQVVVPALARLPVFGAALGLQQGALDGTKRGVPASAFVEDSDPDCVARCGAHAQAPAAALSAGGR